MVRAMVATPGWDRLGTLVKKVGLEVAAGPLTTGE